MQKRTRMIRKKLTVYESLKWILYSVLSAVLPYLYIAFVLNKGGAQKAAIVRMFMRDMPIAILDEPSSALDPIAEYRLNKSMLENAENQAEKYCAGIYA